MSTFQSSLRRSPSVAMRRIGPAAIVALTVMAQSGLAQAASPSSAMPAQTRQVATAGPGVFKQISAGWNFACGLRKGGSAACWGDTVLTETALKPDRGVFTQISTGDAWACGLRSTGVAKCWGAMYSTMTPPSGTFTQISASNYFECGLRGSGAAVCWGASIMPLGHKIRPSGTFTEISAGDGLACGLRPTGAAVCWSVGPGAGGYEPPPGRFSEVGAGYRFACGLRPSGAVACWGSGAPSPPSGTFTHLSVGGGFACGLRSTGKLVCWGVNTHVQPKPPGGSFTQISAGYGLACGLRSGGASLCWGVLTAGTPAPLPTNPVAAVKTMACEGVKCGPRTPGNKNYVAPCYRGGVDPQWSPRMGCPVTTRLQRRLIGLDGGEGGSICRCQGFRSDQVTVRVVRSRPARDLVNVNYHSWVITFVTVKQGRVWLVANTYCAGKPTTTIFGKRFPIC